MTSGMRALAVGLALAAAVLGAGAARAEGAWRLQGHETVATADGALGTLENPALIGLRYPEEVLLGGTWDEFGHDTRFDALGAWRGFGLRYTRWPGEAQTAGVTLAAGAPAFRLGWSAEWAGGDLGGGTVADHRAGLVSRPTPWLSLGATAAHLFQPKAGGELLGRRWTLGAALRPLALPFSRNGSRAAGPRFTLAADAELPEGTPRPRPDWRFGADLELVSGVALRSLYETRGHLVDLGVVFRLPRVAVSAKATGVPREGEKLTAGRGGALFSPYLPSPKSLTAAGRALPNSWSTYTVSLHSGEDRTRIVPPRAGRIATLALSGTLGDDDLAGVSLLGGAEATVPVAPIHRALDRALADPLTRGVLLELSGVSNQAAIEELRPRLLALRAAGKPVVAYLEFGGGRGDLMLASACTLVFSSDEALFWQLGLRSERRYYRKLLDDLGVRVDRSSIGRYKSAYRTWSVDSTPPADREAIEHVLGEAQEHFVSIVATARRMDRARLETLLDGRQWPTEDLKTAGLIDSVGYREDAMRALGDLAGLGAHPRAAQLLAIVPAQTAWAPVRGVAVVYASGGIETGESGNDLFEGPTLGSATLARQIEAAFRDPSVRAVVFRIDSPGGSVLASDLIFHTLERMKAETKKPLVVSMGSVAASGGYYIALPGQRIFADRMTRTGSVGVVFIHPSLEGFYAKHDVREDDFERGRYMRGGSFAKDWDAMIQASADSSIARSYDRFVDRVARARGLSRATVLEHAQGRVWLGEDARSRGLVDEIGGLDAAIAWAQRAAKIPAAVKVEPLEFRRPRPGLFQRVVGSWLREEIARQARFASAEGARYEAGDDLGF